MNGLIPHKSYVEKFYNDAEKKIPGNIIKETSDLNFSAIPKGDPTPTNKNLGCILKELGWITKGEDLWVGSYRLDHFKNGIGLEREFRTDRDLLFDVLKLQLGYNTKKLSSGIIITYDNSVKVKGGNRPYIQELDKSITEFRDGKVLGFTIPLWVIGLR